MTKKIKQEVPDAKVYAVMYGGAAESNLLSDPQNQDQLTGDWAYTQGGRINDWNINAIKYKDSFDGFIVHDYNTTEVVSGLTADDYITSCYAYTQALYDGCLKLNDRVGIEGNKFQITEWGQLCGDVFWAGGYDNAAKKRHQRGKYAISALCNMEMFLQYIKSDAIGAATYHILADSQGFGVYEGGDYITPNYYVFKELGQLVNNKYYYDLQSRNGDYYVMGRPFYHGNYSGNTINIVNNNVDAWGLGDETNVKEIVFSNHTDVPQTISVGGTKIKPTWSYGGDKDTIAPSWDKNETYTSWSNRLQALPNADELIPLPNTYEGAGFTETVTLPPYTMMVAEVEGTPNTIEGHSQSKVSKSTEFRLKHALALKVDNPVAYNDNIKTQVDLQNAAVVPTVKDGRTLLPLRFIAESFGCNVSYDDATQEIVIKNDETTISLTVGKKEYTVNGEAKEFDVAAEVTDGRTLVPLRALAEALGKDVLWDSRGLIIITNAYTAYRNFDEASGVINKGHVDEVDAKIPEVLSLFE